MTISFIQRKIKFWLGLLSAEEYEWKVERAESKEAIRRLRMRIQGKMKQRCAKDFREQRKTGNQITAMERMEMKFNSSL